MVTVRKTRSLEIQFERDFQKNSLMRAHPPSPRAGGITVNEEDVQNFLRVPSLPSGDWEDEPS